MICRNGILARQQPHLASNTCVPGQATASFGGDTEVAKAIGADGPRDLLCLSSSPALQQWGWAHMLIGAAKGRTPADSLDMMVWYWAGEYLWTTQDYAEGLEYSLKALPLTGRWGDPLLVSDCERLVGLFYFRRTDYDKAVEHLSRSLDICRGEGDESRMGSTLNSLAGVCLTSRQLDESEKYILEAIRICEKSDDTHLLPIRYGMASEVYHAKGDNLKSLDYANRAFLIDSLQGNTARMGIRLSQMGELLTKRGARNEAVGHFECAADVFAARGDMYNESRSQRGLYEALKESNPTKASQHLLRYSELKDSIFHYDMEQAVSQFNVKFRTEELIRQEEKARMKNRALVLGLIAAVFLLLFIAAVWFYTSRMQRRKVKELERYIAIRDQYTRLAEKHNEIPKEDIVQADDADLQFLLKVSDAVNAQMDENKKTDVATIAACLCISNSHLYRRIVALTGYNPSSYIQRLKIQRAKDLLDTNPQMNFKEVAYRCGFDTYPNFNRAFKNVMQVTPTEYQKQKARHTGGQ